ncbi:GAL3ST1 [Mytilus coruscus]|uniref:GAL3ST1 n=1 Tax=Mytilus coruscus TaxID=42192 RepID=A0A6J8DJJ3_MYTCO|nr:GAL3ST1 [Mytilus coruscus]
MGCSCGNTTSRCILITFVLIGLMNIWFQCYDISVKGLVFKHKNTAGRTLATHLSLYDTVTMKKNQKGIKSTYANLSMKKRKVNEDIMCIDRINTVAFLKVHKAGSTTVMNIFLRYGESHGLNIALPRVPKSKEPSYWNYLGVDTVLQKERLIPIPQNESYSIICNHVVYSKDKFKEIIGQDVVNIGIIRHPASLFLSGAYYWHIVDILRKRIRGENDNERMSKYLKHPDLFERFMHNRMSFDFGLPVKYFDNDTAIDDKLKSLDTEFSLIMLLEYFVESLVLMKRILCWDLKDILFIPINEYSKEKRNKIKLSPDDMSNLQKYNHADFRLYQYFEKKFMRQLNKTSHNFHEEVEHFKSVQETVSVYCKNRTIDQFAEVLTIKETVWNNSFNITVEECKFMMEQELQLLRRLGKKAENKYRQRKKYD